MAAPKKSQLKKSKPGPRDSGARPGEKRSSGKKPSATNLSRGGGTDAKTSGGHAGKSKGKSRRGSKG